MSFTEPSLLPQFTPVDLLAQQPAPPVTTAIASSTGTAGASNQTSGSQTTGSQTNGSQTSGSGTDESDDAVSTTLSAQQLTSAALSANSGNGASTLISPLEAADAALLNVSGVSAVTIDEFEESVPPNLASASELLNQLASDPLVNTSIVDAAYQLISSTATLALTAD